MNAPAHRFRCRIAAGRHRHFPARAGTATRRHTLAHTRTEFKFTANASFEQTAPLFGANEERKWAPDWNPQFVYPSPRTTSQAWSFRLHTDTFQHVGQYRIRSRRRPYPICLRAE